MHPYRPRFRLTEWRQLAGYSAWNSVIAGAGALRDRVDTIRIGRVLDPAAVGFYAVGFEIAGLPVTELIAPLTRAAFAGFAAAFREDVHAGETWIRLVAGTALLTFPAGIGMSAVAHPLIALAFGPGWEPAVPTVAILGPPLCLTVFGMVGQTLFLAHGHMRTSLAITVGATLVRLLLLLVLIPRLGLSGAALAAAAGIALEQALSGWWAMRRLRLSLGRDLLPAIWRCVLATAAMAAALWAIRPGLARDDAALVSGGDPAGRGRLLACCSSRCGSLAGRPAGPEADLLELTGRALRRRLA